MSEHTPNPHRGRLQAQGGGLEESEPWDRTTPLPQSEGLGLVLKLENKLTAGELKERERAFSQLRTNIARWATIGGLQKTDKLIKLSYPKPQRGDVRVDVEVHAGVAFVKDA